MQNLIFMVGLPASGKSTIANQYRDKGYVVLSSDELREELYGDASNQDHNSDLFIELYRRARLQLSLGFDVVIDATNVVSKRRISGLESILKNTKKDKIQLDRSGIHVVAEIVACPYNECIDRNKLRDRKVPNGVIENMYKQWQTPIRREGFDEVKLTYTSEIRFDIDERLSQLQNFNQMNINHKLSLGEHCKQVGNSLFADGYDKLLVISGKLHDIAKPFCISFHNSNGKHIDSSTYYGHDSASAYESFFYVDSANKLNNDEILYISQLINHHMKIKFIESIKSHHKLISLLGEQMYNDVCVLNEYDNKNRGV